MSENIITGDKREMGMKSKDEISNLIINNNYEFIKYKKSMTDMD